MAFRRGHKIHDAVRERLAKLERERKGEKEYRRLQRALSTFIVACLALLAYCISRAMTI